MGKSKVMKVKDIVDEFGEEKAADIISLRAAYLVALTHLDEWKKLTNNLTNNPDAKVKVYL